MSVEQSVEVAASPARAWQLVSTSEGLTSWFVAAEVLPGAEGTVTLRFGPGAEGTMPISGWDPPYRIRFGAAKDEPGRAHDFEVTATPAGGAVVAVVDCGLQPGEVDGARGAWAGYLARLKTVAEAGA